MRIGLELLTDIPTPWSREKGYAPKRTFLKYSPDIILEIAEDATYLCSVELQDKIPFSDYVRKQEYSIEEFTRLVNFACAWKLILKKRWRTGK